MSVIMCPKLNDDSDDPCSGCIVCDPSAWEEVPDTNKEAD